MAQNPAQPVEALLALRVVDPACGSGHFLLAAARRLAERVAALRSPDGAVTPQAYRHALREVVARCIFGVDRNPMAIELARTALWIEGFEEGRPLSFMDHHLQCGDALLGLTDLKALEHGIAKDAFKVLSGDDKAVCKELAKANSAALKDLQKKRIAKAFGQLDVVHQADSGLAALQAIETMPEADTDQIAAKAQAYDAYLTQARTGRLAQAAQLLLGAYLLPKTEATAHAVPTTATLYLTLQGAALPASQRAAQAAANAACEHARVLHWPLAFPQVFAAGGFDCVLGNPPWERIKLQEEEFFATRHKAVAEARNKAERSQRIQWLSEGMLAQHLYPGTGLGQDTAVGVKERELYAEFITARRTAEAASLFAHVNGEDGGRYPLTGVGDVNTYALFAETILQLKVSEGRAGFIVPTGIATDSSTKAFFSTVVRLEQLVSLLDFDNAERAFPAVATLVRFSLVTLGKSDQATFAFLLKNASHLSDERRKFFLSASDFALVNPNTLTCPVFNSRTDAELTRKIYTKAPVLIRESSQTDSSLNPWSVRLGTMFHMSNDSHLFQSKEQLPTGSRIAVGRMALEPSFDGYMPLYEAKMMTIYDHRFGTYPPGTTDDTRALPRLTQEQYSDPNFEVNPRFFLKGEQVKQAASEPLRSWLICFRAMSNHSNVRRFISGVIPFSAVGNSLVIISPTTKVGARSLACLVGNLGSMVMDAVARWKIAGTNLNNFLVQQFPVLPPEAYSKDDENYIAERVLELIYTTHSLNGFAEDLGYFGPPFPWIADRRIRVRAELDAWFARAYGLSRDELRYILDPGAVMGDGYPSETFRVLKENEEREFGEYRTSKLVLAAWDSL